MSNVCRGTYDVARLGTRALRSMSTQYTMLAIALTTEQTMNPNL